MILLQAQPTNGWDALCLALGLGFSALVLWLCIR